MQMGGFFMAGVLGIYVHIPFCKSKCRYCDFASYAGCETLMPRYIDSLLQEAALQAEHLNHPAIETVFIGGGSILLRKYIECSPKISKHIIIDDIAANEKGYDLLYRADHRK